MNGGALNSMKTIEFSLKSIVVMAFLLGAYEHFRPKRNMCAMTYMYQLPEYLPIALDEETQKSFPVYKLYSYGEGSYARRLQSGHYDGIPVLFLHGNAGSYKQVRSLASVSMTKAASNRSPFHFDYFAADFDEEFSAVYGNLLFKQTEFTSICIKVILKLYEGRPSQPSSVVLVGHSMGGMIARALFTLEDFDSNRIQLIMTKATPHAEPVFTPDSYMADFYSQVNRHWHAKRNSSLRHVNLVSISGGREDLMVRSDLTGLSLRKQPSHVRDISISSNAVPGVWTGMDHLCIVWCNQLVLAIVRSTFKLIDQRTRQLIADSETRHRLLTRLLVDGAHIKSHSLRTAANWTVPMSYEDLWTSRGSERWEYKSSDVFSATSILLITIGAQSKRDRHLFVATLNLNLEPWIFTCKSDGHLCHVTGVPSCETLHVPSSDGPRRVFRCDKMDSEHFVIKLPSESIGKVEVYAEVFDPVERQLETSWLGSAVGFRLPTSTDSLFYSMKLYGLSETWEAYRVHVQTSGSSCKDPFAGVIHFSVPWNFEDTFENIEFHESEHSIRLHSSRPLKYSTPDGPEIRFYLNPKCEYTVTVRFSWKDTMAQVVRFYAFTFPAFIAAACLQTLTDLESRERRLSRITSLSLMTMVQSMAKVFAVTTTLNFVFEHLDLVSERYERGWNILPLLIVYVVSSVVVTAAVELIRVAVIIIGKIPITLPCRSSLQRWRLWNPAYFVVMISSCLVFGPFIFGMATTFVTVMVLMFRPAPIRSNKKDVHLTCCLICGLIFLFGLPSLVACLANFRFGEFALVTTVTRDRTEYFMTLLLFGRRFFLDNLPVRSTWIVSCHSLLAIGILVFGIDHVYHITTFLVVDCLSLFMWLYKETFRD